MFGVPSSTYYSWIGRLEDKNGYRAKKAEKELNICEYMKRIVVARSGLVPGKRTFKAELFRRFNIVVSTKKIARLMKQMKLVAQRPHKDAYKHQVSHNHVCAAPDNSVDQDFFQGPRKIVLTDITYLYYGYSRVPFYLCVFRDPYTKENLGWAVDNTMDVSLIKHAYDHMMQSHRNEFKDYGVLVHSDQGAQYLSTTFKQLLEDDGFVQSVSARGNSQDNAPMESFFSRLKTEIMDLVAVCKNINAAKSLVDGYLKAYNSEHYQYDLAALTPNEFYQYATTGIYPLESYFGVSSDDMMAVDDLKKVRRQYADEEARQRREASKTKREQKRMIDPLKIVIRDQNMVKKKIDEWTKSEDIAKKQLTHMNRLLEKIKEASKYIANLLLNHADRYEELNDPLTWRKYDELCYVFEMNELF